MDVSERTVDRVSVACGAVVVGLSLLLLVSRMIEAAASRGGIPVIPWVQVAAVMLGIGLLLAALSRSRPRLTIVTTVIAAAVLVVAVPSLIVRLTQPALDSGQLEQFARGFEVQPRVPGTLNPLAPALLSVVSLSLLLLMIRRANAVLGILTVLIAAFGLSIILSVFYGGGTQGPAGWRLSWIVGSYLTLFSVGVVLLAGSTTWPFSAFAGSPVRALMLRWLTPFTIFVVLGTDVLSIRVFPHFSSGVGSVLTALASVVVAVVMSTSLARVIGDRIDRAQEARRRAQDAARTSEEKFSTIFQSAPVGISITDVESGNVLEINDDAKRLLGFSRDEAVGHTTADLRIWANPEERESTWQRMQSTGGVEDVEVTLRAKSGKLIPVRYSGQIVEIDGRQQLLSTWVDISARKLAEKALKQSEEKFATVFQAAPVGISVSDPVDSRILEANEEWIHVLGFARDEVIGKSAVDLGVWPEPADREAITDRLKRGAAARDAEREIRAKDGTLVTVRGSIQYVELSGAPVMVSAFVNVTDRKRAEEELRHSEEQYRSLVDESRAIIAVVTTAGITTYLNPAFERVTGWSRAEWLGQPFAGTLHADDTARMGEMLAAAARQEPDIIGELRLRTTNEKPRIGEFHITPQMRDGNVAGILVVARDVTDRVQLEHQFRQAQKMEAVGRLAGGVAHDFNNLLTVISSYTSLILAEGEQSAAVRDDLEEIAKAADSAAALTRQLLAFSRQEVVEPKSLDVNDVVRHASKMLKRVIGEDVELRTSLRGDLGNVLADSGQLEQVIMNLVVNARDAMPAGGSVTIETSNVELTGDFIDDAQQVKPGHYVMMAVTDSGTGMDEQTKARIFEPFFTTKEVGRGTGLGLSTVYGIVKQSAGYLWVYSELGRGTTFKIYFPRTDAADAPSVGASALSSTNGTETVLLVEDVAAVRDVVRRVLQGRGYSVLDAGTALEALTLAGSYAGTIDLLLTDIVLPGANGRELAEQIKQTRPAMRVLFTSGYTDDAVIRLGILHRGFAFMQKPFGPQTVERKVRDTLDAPVSA